MTSIKITKLTQFYRALVGAAVLLCLCACNTTKTKVESDFDHKTNFSAYQTFAFLSSLGTDEAEYSTLTSAYFKTAAKAEMEALGYTYSETTPDLLVNFFFDTQTRSDVKNGSQGYAGFGYPSYFYFGYPYHLSGTKTKHYKMGEIRIDIVDAKEKKLIWQGSLEKKIRQRAVENPEQSIAATVQRIFQQYPLHTTQTQAP